MKVKDDNFKVIDSKKPEAVKVDLSSLKPVRPDRKPEKMVCTYDVSLKLM